MVKIRFIFKKSNILYNIEKKPTESALQKLLQKQIQTNVVEEEQINKG